LNYVKHVKTQQTRLQFQIYPSIEVNELVFDYERSLQEIVKCE